jgi:hypothetical protein
MSSVRKHRIIRGKVNLYRWEGSSRTHTVLYAFGRWFNLG